MTSECESSDRLNELSVTLRIAATLMGRREGCGREGRGVAR
eukprot:COSAG03_NODE_29886_length_174_cov_16.880000_1_plen_40_part_01